jgi:hypothetical protein
VTISLFEPSPDAGGLAVSGGDASPSDQAAGRRHVVLLSLAKAQRTGGPIASTRFILSGCRKQPAEGA